MGAHAREDFTMPKTYFLGRTQAGAVVARASANDYGFTHAAVIDPQDYDAGDQVRTCDAKFSTSAAGAIRNLGSLRAGRYEVVPVEKVDAATFKAATGKR